MCLSCSRRPGRQATLAAAEPSLVEARRLPPPPSSLPARPSPGRGQVDALRHHGAYTTSIPAGLVTLFLNDKLRMRIGTTEKYTREETDRKENKRETK